jgi:hypothetical protein
LFSPTATSANVPGALGGDSPKLQDAHPVASSPDNGWTFVDAPDATSSGTPAANASASQFDPAASGHGNSSPWDPNFMAAPAAGIAASGVPTGNISANPLSQATVNPRDIMTGLPNNDYLPFSQFNDPTGLGPPSEPSEDLLNIWNEFNRLEAAGIPLTELGRSTAHASTGQTSAGQASAGQAPAAQAPVAQPSAAQAPVAQASAGQAPSSRLNSSLGYSFTPPAQPFTSSYPDGLPDDFFSSSFLTPPRRSEGINISPYNATISAGYPTVQYAAAPAKLQLLDSPTSPDEYVYPRFQKLFSSAEEAKRHRKSTRNNVYPDVLLAWVKATQRDYWVEEIYNAMINIYDVEDGEGSNHRKRFSDSKIIDHKDLEATAHAVFDKACSIHERGWTKPRIYLAEAKRGGKVDKNKENVQGRLAAICQTLRKSKAACNDALQGGISLLRLCYNAEMRVKSKDANKRGNTAKKEIIEKGRKA